MAAAPDGDRGPRLFPVNSGAAETRVPERGLPLQEQSTWRTVKEFLSALESARQAFQTDVPPRHDLIRREAP